MRRILFISIVCSLFALQVGCNTLEMAYNQGGSGAGREIKADSGAVSIIGKGGLVVEGSIESNGGFTFPDGKTQIEAQVAGPVGPIGPAGPRGPKGSIGLTGADSTVPGPQGADSTVPGPQGPSGTSMWKDGAGQVTTLGNVGIGTTSPNRKLIVQDGYLGIYGSNGNNGLLFIDYGAGPTQWDITGKGDKLYLNQTGKVNAMTFKTGGNVGIGTTEPDYKLDVTGGVRFNIPKSGEHQDWRVNSSDEHIALYVSGGGGIGIRKKDIGDFSFYVNGKAGGLGSWFGSDRRWKKNVQLIPNALDKISNLNGISYEWKNKEFPNKNFDKGRQLGLVAQEVEKYFPELVKEGPNGYKHMNYNGLVGVVIEAVKELKAENDIVKNNNDQLRKELLALKDKQEAIEDMLLALSTNLHKEKLVILDDIQK
jgi:hypothetical protein